MFMFIDIGYFLYFKLITNYCIVMLVFESFNEMLIKCIGLWKPHMALVKSVITASV